MIKNGAFDACWTFFAVIVSLFVVVGVRGLRVFFLSDCNLFV